MTSRQLQLCLTLCMFAISLTVSAAQRTFVSATGTDANPCSITLPCRSFGAALAQTASSGEVIVLDSAGYGAVTITKSASITAPSGVYAGISVSAGDAITVNAGASDVVVLRGLVLNNQGSSGSGIVVTSGARLSVEAVTVSGFGSGIRATGPSVPSSVSVKDSVFRRNGVGLSVASGAGTQITIDSVTFENNSSDAVLVTSAAGSGEIHLTVDNSVLTGDSAGGSIRLVGGVASAIGIRASIMRTKVAGTGGGGRGVVVAGALTVATIADCHISGMSIGIETLNGPSGVGVLQSLQNSLFVDNAIDSTGAATVTPL